MQPTAPRMPPTLAADFCSLAPFSELLHSQMSRFGPAAMAVQLGGWASPAPMVPALRELVAGAVLALFRSVISLSANIAWDRWYASISARLILAWRPATPRR